MADELPIFTSFRGSMGVFQSSFQISVTQMFELMIQSSLMSSLEFALSQS